MIKRKLTVLLIALLALSLVVPAYLSSVSSSVGYIRINNTSSSTEGQQMQAGSNINLYFGGVTWSNTAFYLFLSQDGLQNVSSGDFVYTPLFSIYAVVNTSAVTTYSQDNCSWVAGSNWINGSIPRTLALGNYYIKAVDQISSVAVTDKYFTVNSMYYGSTLNISPAAGPGGVDITFTGTNYPPSSAVQISYYDPASKPGIY